IHDIREVFLSARHRDIISGLHTSYRGSLAILVRVLGSAHGISHGSRYQPVRHDHALISPLVSQRAGLDILRVAGMLSIYQVVGAHQRMGLRSLHADLKSL